MACMACSGAHLQRHRRLALPTWLHSARELSIAPLTVIEQLRIIAYHLRYARLAPGALGCTSGALS